MTGIASFPEYIRLHIIKMPQVFLYFDFLLGYKTSVEIIHVKKNYSQVLSNHHISNSVHIILIMVKL